MAAFESTFDAKEWIREQGVATSGRDITLHLDNSHLGATIAIPNCASWNLELGSCDNCVGQGQWNQHQGFRGTILDLLEKAKCDIEMNRGMHGEEAAPKFDALLEFIDLILKSDPDEHIVTFTLQVRDASGLCGIPAELSTCVAKDIRFERTEGEKAMLIPLEPAEPVDQLNTVEQIAELVRQASCIVALTGAGISVESGITPFRNPSDGDKGSIWGNFDAAKMTVQNFNADPEVTLGWWKMKRSLVSELHSAVPNPAHKFFAMLEEMGKLGAVVTQNIDSLHQDSGVSAEKVIELHGHMRGLICSDNKTVLNPLTYKRGECTFCIPKDSVDAIDAAYKEDQVPVCPDCGCPLRTETVMFGQPMPLGAVDSACKAIDKADLIFVIGSTLIVEPANQLPSIALRNGAPLVMINFDETRYDVYAKGLIRQKAGEFLGAVAADLEQRQESLATSVALREAPRAIEKSLKPEEVKLARVAKEGSRRGKEIAVNAKACSMTFFCTAVSDPEGNFALLEHSLAAMNAECADIGKMFFSDCSDQLAVVAQIPDALAGDLNCGDWLQAVSQAIGGKVLESTGNFGKLVIRAGVDVYPIKLKELGITAAIQFLKEKGLFACEDDEDDDFVFGDDDFPS
jgi:NAD-dependent deacetylase